MMKYIMFEDGYIVGMKFSISVAKWRLPLILSELIHCHGKPTCKILVKLT